MERTLVIFKPSCLQRCLLGEVISRFEKKGLRLVGLKMTQLTDELLSVHYSHLSQKPYFQRVKDAMMAAPVVVSVWEGVGAVDAVRVIAGATCGRLAAPGTIRADYSMSFQENIVHASDSVVTAKIEVERFFLANELFDYKQAAFKYLYAADEY